MNAIKSNSFVTLHSCAVSGDVRLLDRVSAGTACYCGALLCYCLMFFLKRSELESIFFMPMDTWVKCLQFAAVGLAVAKIVMQRYTWRQTLVCGCLIGLTAISAFASGGNLVLLWAVMFIVAGQDIELRQIAMSVLVGVSLIFFLVVGSWFCGVIESVSFERGDTIETVRESLGFSHPNSIGACVLAIVAAIAVLRFPHFGIADVAVFSAGFAIVYFASDSRTALVAMAVLGVVHVACVRAESTRTLCVVFVACMLAVLIVAGVSLSFMVLYDPSAEWLVQIDDVISKRFYYAHHYFDYSTFSIFGHDFSDTDPLWLSTGETTMLIDNAYCRLYLHHGVIMFAVVLVGMVGLFVKAAREAHGGTVCLCAAGLFAMCIAGIAESYMLSPSVNFFLLACSTLIYSKPLASMGCARKIGREPEQGVR